MVLINALRALFITIALYLIHNFENQQWQDLNYIAITYTVAFLSGLFYEFSVAKAEQYFNKEG